MKKDLKRSEKRLNDLDKLIEAAFEEKVSGKIPENVCVKLIEKYTAEQTELKEKIAVLSQGLEEVTQAKTDVDEFIRRLKTYFNSPTLTREMCLALFDHLVIGGKEAARIWSVKAAWELLKFTAITSAIIRRKCIPAIKSLFVRNGLRIWR